MDIRKKSDMLEEPLSLQETWATHSLLILSDRESTEVPFVGIMPDQGVTHADLAIDSNAFEDNHGNVQVKRTRKDFPWLVVNGDLCYSDKQRTSGKDLSQTKKKYRPMFCSYCAEYNPSTPWATLKARKYESDNFNEHEKSSHHMKAVEAKNAHNEMGNNDGGSVVSSNCSKSQHLPQDSLAWPETHMIAPVTDPYHYNHLDHSYTSQAISSLAALSLPSMPLSLASFQSQKPFESTSSFNQGSVTSNSEINKPAVVKAKYSPDWLHAEGKLIFSEGQVESGKDLTKKKKKYKLCLCKYCAEFVPESPWSILKARKFESSTFYEHDRSLLHQKALEMIRESKEQMNLDGNCL